ncbi:MAG: methyltransferase domain-containing protein [Alphaproteobacteria bacterium]|nr:MAG: methyltransferase domain-containing protein [Alphaproteobacteria bacterium]
MHLDVVDLRSFYYRTRLGRRCKDALRDRITRLWPDCRGMTVAGFGFAAPLLRPFLEDARRVLCLMPGQQGVMPWPGSQPNVSLLVEETLWPLPTGFVDRLIVAHGLETCDRPGLLLDEIWRVLAPAGRVIFVVPNRSGLWARRDATPFGFGRPYSLSQIEMQLRRHRFTPEGHEAALFAPPSERRFWIRTSRFWERLGQSMGASRLAGALLVEASKQVYVLPRDGARESARGPLEILQGLAPKQKPAMGRVSGPPRG